jgi:23S rRNA (cytidine1920-2'-O)/16S rRNA (cytidine1409-2'-O)-methyltransferase
MTPKPARKRLDALLVERGLADSLPKARAMILAGEVRIDGQLADKAGASLMQSAQLTVVSRAQKYTSRGGFKLEGALSDFSVDPTSLVCLDVGSSTGGFTDCLLQHGASRVYAVDVRVDQLAWKLRQDARVLRIERNARELRPQDIPEPIDLAVADVSFISVAKVLRPAALVLRPAATMLILVKPQFELPSAEVGGGGIVTDPGLHKKAIDLVQRAAVDAGLEILGVRPSQLTGAEGNQEYFLHTRKKTLR